MQKKTIINKLKKQYKILETISGYTSEDIEYLANYGFEMFKSEISMFGVHLKDVEKISIERVVEIEYNTFSTTLNIDVYANGEVFGIDWFKQFTKIIRGLSDCEGLEMSYYTYDFGGYYSSDTLPENASVINEYITDNILHIEYTER